MDGVCGTEYSPLNTDTPPTLDAHRETINNTSRLSRVTFYRNAL